MKSTYTVHSGDILRHGSGDGWIRVDSFDGDTFSVTDVDIVTGAEGTTSLLTMSDMLRCVKEETGSTYSRVIMDTSSLSPIITVDSFGSDCPSNWEEIADALNNLINERGIYFDSDAIDALWEDFCSGDLEGVPAPVME